MRATLRAFRTLSPLTLLTLVAALAQNKVLAVTLGPSGTGIYFLAAAFLTAISTLAGLGVSSALSKLVSERRDADREGEVLSAALTGLAAVTATSLLLGGAVLLAQDATAGAFLDDDALSAGDRDFILLVTAAGLTPVVWHATLVGVLRGLRSLRDYVIAGYVGVALPALAVMAGAAIGGWRWAYAGFVLAEVATSVAFALFALRMARRTGVPLRILPRGTRRPLGRQILRLGALALVAALAVSLGNALLRTQLAAGLGVAALGLFAGAWSISNRLPALIYQTLTSYVAPAVSAHARDWPKIVDEQNHACRLSLLAATPLLCVVAAAAPLLIPLLFSDEFSPMLDLLRLMLVGELIGIVVWSLNMSLYPTGRAGAALIMEYGFWGLFVTGGLLAAAAGELALVGAAYIAAQALTATGVFVAERRHHRFGWTGPNARLIAASVAAAAVLAALGLGDAPAAVVAAATPAALAVWALVSTTAGERRRARALVAGALARG